MMKDFGVVYIGTGERIVKEILQSASSLKKVHPEMRITVFSDREIGRPELFESVQLISDPKYSYIDKILPLTETPYEYTLYLDSDTIVLNPVTALFELLDQFDLAIALEPKPKQLQYPTQVPESFPEYNTGVFSYRKNVGNMDLFRQWHACYSEQKANVPGTTHDQPAFREVLYHSPVRFTTLPSQYNLRPLYLTCLSRNIETTIVHHRSFDMKKLDLLKGKDYEKMIVPDPFVLDAKRFVILGRGGSVFRKIITTFTGFMKLFSIRKRRS
jgi:hypothetical protein